MAFDVHERFVYLSFTRSYIVQPISMKFDIYWFLGAASISGVYLFCTVLTRARVLNNSKMYAQQYCHHRPQTSKKLPIYTRVRKNQKYNVSKKSASLNRTRALYFFEWRSNGCRVLLVTYNILVTDFLKKRLIYIVHEPGQIANANRFMYVGVICIIDI